MKGALPDGRGGPRRRVERANGQLDPGHRSAAVMSMCALAFAVTAWGRPSFVPAATRELGPTRDRGEALFMGRLPLRGRIRAHEGELPPAVVSCVNCHGGRDATAAFPAPHLDRTLLTEARARRGGPPSAYDAASFCRLLGSGVDPAYVLVAREMPSYDLSEADCLALWGYLTATERAPKGGPSQHDKEW